MIVDDNKPNSLFINYYRLCIHGVLTIKWWIKKYTVALTNTWLNLLSISWWSGLGCLGMFTDDSLCLWRIDEGSRCDTLSVLPISTTSLIAGRDDLLTISSRLVNSYYITRKVKAQLSCYVWGTEGNIYRKVFDFDVDKCEWKLFNLFEQ